MGLSERHRRRLRDREVNCSANAYSASPYENP
jgi:hypothetical protein